jgi:O-antigen/teichoic acid export membrane protein
MDLGLSKNYNQLKVGAALSYISMGVGYIIYISYTPVMLRLLGQSEYGLFNLVASVVAYLGLLNFGFGSAYMRYYSIYRTDDDYISIAKLNGMFLIVFSVFSIIALVAGILLVYNANVILGSKLTDQELAKAKILMIIMVISVATSFPSIVFDSFTTANEKFIFQKLLQLIKVIVNPLFILPVLFLGCGSIGMAIATTVLNIFFQFANMFFCFKTLKIKFLFGDFNLSLMKEITIFSSYMFMSMIIDQINWNVGKYIVGRFCGTIAVAVYGLAAQLNVYYMSLSTTVSNVFIPRINRMVAENKNNEELTDLFTRVGRVQFIILSIIGLGLVFFGKPFIIMWAGTNYSEAYLIVLLLVIPVTVPLIQNTGIEIQKAKNMHQFRSWTYLFIAIVNICIAIPLTQTYGGVGAAIGTAFSLLIGNGFIMNWYYHNRVGLDMKKFWTQILRIIPSLIPPAIFGWLIYSFSDIYHIKTFLACSIIYVCIFCISLWFIGMNQYEKALISDPIKRILRKS